MRLLIFSIVYLSFLLGVNAQSIVCGDSFTDPNGVSQNYNPIEQVVDTISANPGSIIELVFETLELSDNDTIFLIDPLFPDTLVGAVTNQTEQDTFYSWSSELILNFISINPTPSLGWLAHVNCTESSFISLGAELDTICEGFEGFISREINIPLSGDVQIVAELSDEFGSFDSPVAAGESFASQDSLYIQLPAGLVEDANYRIRISINDEDYAQYIYEETISIRTFPHQPEITGSQFFCGDSVQLFVNDQDRIELQWFLNNDELFGKTDTSLFANTEGTYSVSATNFCGVVFSPAFTLTELSIPEPANLIYSDPFFCSGDSLLIEAENIQAQSSLTWFVEEQSTIDTLESLYILSESTVFVRSENICGESFSDTITIEELPVPGIPEIINNGSTQFCEGENVELSVVNPEGFQVNWFFQGNQISSGNSNLANAEGAYFVRWENECGIEESEPLEIEVLPQPVPAFIEAAGPTTLCEGNSVVLVIENQANDNVEWLLNNSSIDEDTEMHNAVLDGIYKVVTSNSCGTVESVNDIEVEITPLPEVPIIFNSGTPALCEGSTVNLFVSQQTDVNFVWRKNGSLVSGNSNSIEVSQAGVYTVSATNSCGTVNSEQSFDVTIGSPPTVPQITASGPTTFCEGLSVNLLSSPQNGLVFQWYRNGEPVGENAFSFAASQAGTYTLKVSNACDTLSSSNSILVNLNPLPPEVEINPFTEQNLCLGESVQLSIPTLPGVSYQWRRDGDPIGQNQPSLETSVEGEYAIVLANSCGTRNSVNTVVVNVDSLLPQVQVIIPQPGTALCEGGYVLLNALPVPFQTFNWYLDGELIEGVNSAVLQATSWGEYSVEAVNACGISSISENVSLSPGDPPQDFQLIAEAPFEFCSNDSIAITAQVNFGVGVRWFLNDSLVNEGPAQIFVSEPGVYTANAWNGCGEATGLNTLTMSELPAPPIPEISLIDNLLTCNLDGQFQWYDSALNAIEGEINSSYSPPPINSSYFVSVTNEFGCTSLSQAYTYIIGGINQLASEDLFIHPNPASNQIAISIKKDEFMVCFNANGVRQKLRRLSNSEAQVVFDISELSNGLYFILSESGSSRFVKSN